MTQRLAVLRPEPGNSATAARARAAGFEVMRLPLFTIRPLYWTPPDPAEHDALILTSANTVRWGGAGLTSLRALPVLAVGEQTAAVARTAGFDVMAVGAGDARDVATVAAAHGLTRVLHLGGRERVPVTSAILTRALAVYASDENDIDHADLSALASTTALLHSVRAARRLAALIEANGIFRASIAIGAFSPAIALEAGEGWRRVAIARAPTDAALFEAVSDAVRGD